MRRLSLEDPAHRIYDVEAIEAVNKFRSDQKWGTAVPGFVDANTIDRLWQRLEEAGKADEVRERLRDIVRVTR
jgi:hypothetical protein